MIGTVALFIVAIALTVALMLYTKESTSYETVEPGISLDYPKSSDNSPVVSDREKNIIYEGCDMVNYLDLDSCASERKNASVEIVMIHFSSAVKEDKNNPYDIDLIRGMFESQKTSTHYFIDREGKVHCWLPEELAAINAGAGTFGVSKYLNNMNEYAISIELAAIGSCNDMSDILTKEDYNLLSAGVVGYTKAQHESLKLLLEDICGRYKIPYDRQHIIGHSDYNEKKKEPGELFDWSAVGLR